MEDVDEMTTDTVVVTIHGQESKGKKMEDLAARLATDFDDSCHFINIKYTRLLTIVNTLPWVRTMTAKYIAARLETIGYTYTDARIVVIAHSNGSRATSIVLEGRDNPKKKWPMFWIDGLILLGCPMKRKFDWSKYPATNVVNFVSRNDFVVFLARAYGMGAAGRYGFKKKAKNLRQIYVKCGHSGFMKHYSMIKGAVKLLLSNAWH